MAKSMAKWFAAGAYFARNSKDGKWYVFGATSKKYINDVKFPGGCEEPSLNEATPEETLVREYFNESKRYNPYRHLLVHTEQKLGHVQYYYLILKAEGELDFNYKTEGPEPDGDYLYLRWWTLRDFIEHVGIKEHRNALNAMLEKMAKINQGFAQDNYDVIPG
jgi:hypothetical protein